MITGTLAHPLINGNIRLIDGAMKWRALKNPVQNMQMDNFEVNVNQTNAKAWDDYRAFQKD